MIVIIDSNIFVSALITPNGTVASVLSEKGRIQFLVLDYVIEEVENHAQKIADISAKAKKEVLTDFRNLIKGIGIIDKDEIPKKDLIEAKKIVQDIDIHDAYFVALHLYKKHKIWTGDNELADALKAKGYNFCITTSELKRYIYKKQKK